MTDYDHIPPPLGARHQVVRSLRDQGLIRESLGARLAKGGGLAAVAVGLVLVGVALGPVVRVQTNPVDSPQFLLLLYEGEGFQGDESHIEEYAVWAGSLSVRGHLVSAEKLTDEIHALGGSGVSEAPTGFFLIRAPSAESALELARESPHLKYGGTVMVRQVDHRDDSTN